MRQEQQNEQYLDNIKRLSEKQKRISEADDHWKELSAKLEKFYREHAGLRELIRESVPQNGE